MFQQVMSPGFIRLSLTKW